jgi:hypothetical protein
MAFSGIKRVTNLSSDGTTIEEGEDNLSRKGAVTITAGFIAKI